MSDSFLGSDQRPANAVFDLDGVVFLGNQTIAGAGATLDAIAACGTKVLFATNNATKTPSYISDRIESTTGFVPEPGTVVTSATAVAATLDAEDDPVLMVGEAGLAEALTTAGRTLTNRSDLAHTVVVGLDRKITYDKLEHAATAIRRGARFIATNTDVTFPMPDGPVPGAGAIVAAIAAASGADPEIAGKPHPTMVRHISELLSPGDTWMVGDRAETDLALARAAGWTSVLTLSGITRTVDEVPAHLRPDLVVDSIADLTRWFLPEVVAQ